MKVIAIIGLLFISTTLAATAQQLACITGCKAAGAAEAALSVSDLAKYTADAAKETEIIAAKTCVYPLGTSPVSDYCAFGVCFKKAYTLTSVAGAKQLACEGTCVGGCSAPAPAPLPAGQITPLQLTCIAGCKTAGAAAAALSGAANLAKYTTDAAKEATIIAAKTCAYPTLTDQVSKYCAFGECFKKAYTLTSDTAKTQLACEGTCVGGCAAPAPLPAGQITVAQLACIGACKTVSLAACAASVAETAKCTADGAKEASILAAKTCTYPTDTSQVSVYCAFGECFKKAYTLTATSTKNLLECETKCVGTCAKPTPTPTPTPGKTTSSGLTIGFNLLAIVAGIFMLKM